MSAKSSTAPLRAGSSKGIAMLREFKSGVLTRSMRPESAYAAGVVAPAANADGLGLCDGGEDAGGCDRREASRSALSSGSMVMGASVREPGGASDGIGLPTGGASTTIYANGFDRGGGDGSEPTGGFTYHVL